RCRVSIAERAAEALDAIRRRQPRIHCLTNTAAHVLTANALLAVGAVPSLTGSSDEVADFARSADGLLVNLGTLDEDRRAAIGLAIDAVQNTGTPWLLDPALCDRSALRARWAVDYARRGPVIVRTNAAEFGTLAGRLDAATPEEVARRLGSVLV